MPPSGDKTRIEKVLEEVASIGRLVLELQLHMNDTMKIVEKHDDINEGTLQRKGLKERITMAEENIRLNKEAWAETKQELKVLSATINTTIRESYIEIEAKMDKELKGIAAKLEEQQTFKNRLQPYVNLIAWILAAVGIGVITQIVSGNWRIVAVP